MNPSYQNAESKAVDAIKKAIPNSLKQNMLKESKGMFAELYENNEVFPQHYIACGIDGVGTKAIVAEAMNKFDTIGIDCVAVCANDLATLGSVSPFLFMDSILCQNEIRKRAITGDIAKGMSKGLEQCNASSILKNSIKTLSYELKALSSNIRSKFNEATLSRTFMVKKIKKTEPNYDFFFAHLVLWNKMQRAKLLQYYH